MRTYLHTFTGPTICSFARGPQGPEPVVVEPGAQFTKVTISGGPGVWQNFDGIYRDEVELSPGIHSDPELGVAVLTIVG